MNGTTGLLDWQTRGAHFFPRMGTDGLATAAILHLDWAPCLVAIAVANWSLTNDL